MTTKAIVCTRKTGCAVASYIICIIAVVHCTSTSKLCNLSTQLGAMHLVYYAATRHSFGLDYGKVILGFVHFK